MSGNGIEVFIRPSLYHFFIDLIHVTPERRDKKLPSYRIDI